jgi:hypothetical protein
MHYRGSWSLRAAPEVTGMNYVFPGGEPTLGTCGS